MSTRAHCMPFGARVGPEGVLFQLWAPDAARVELRLSGPGAAGGEDRHRDLVLDRQAGGWHRLLVPEAAAGDLYRYRPDGGPWVPDPASRCQAEDVHGPSLVVDPESFPWQDDGWRGRPWAETVLYEAHVGAATGAGTFAGLIGKLDRLADLGVTALELMPIADFPGRRNWGYDGVLPFAPDRSYGRPEELKRLVQEAHARGLQVFLDVVYNHFGPEGNYLHLYAKAFFAERRHTPWGAAIDFDGPRSRTVRDFFVDNALYWLHEYNLDGLRLDAVDRIHDDSRPDILQELAERVAAGPGGERPRHLVLENDANLARHLERGPGGRPRAYTAQWDEDLHHAAHVILTGEKGGYYSDYADEPARHLARALAEGFSHQGDPSPYRDGARRGEPSAHLPPDAFVSFLQNHDQIGNRALGERLRVLAPEPALRALVAVQLLAPSPPLLFMGEETGSRRPFHFFCDFDGELARLVTEGRRSEFARFPQFSDPVARLRIPDPNAPATFEACRLEEPAEEHGNGSSESSSWRRWYRNLLHLRHQRVVPLLRGAPGGGARWETLGPHTIAVIWTLGGGARLSLLANLQAEPFAGATMPPGERIFASDEALEADLPRGRLGPWAVAWFLAEGERAAEAR